MKKQPSKSRMPLIIIGFVIVMAAIVVINRYILKGISETEKQIKYFQTQSGVKQQPLQDMSVKTGSPQETVQPAPPKKIQPSRAVSGASEGDDVIYEPALDSVILVQ